MTVHLLGGDSCSLVPREVDAVVLDALLLRLLLRRDEPSPSVLLAVLDRLLLGVEFDVHVGQRVAGRRPAHERILPALAVVEFHSPRLEVVGAALH